MTDEQREVEQELAKWERYGYIGSGKLDRIRVPVKKDSIGRIEYRDVTTSEIVKMQHEFLKLREREQRELKKCVLALCPTCNPDHVLDNGRVWALCRANKLVGAQFSEAEIATVIRALPTPPEEAQR